MWNGKVPKCDMIKGNELDVGNIDFELGPVPKYQGAAWLGKAGESWATQNTQLFCSFCNFLLLEYQIFVFMFSISVTNLAIMKS